MGPQPISMMIEEQIMPVVVKLANVFQGIAASFSCCPSKHRAAPIKLQTKKSVKSDFKRLENLLNRLKGELKGKKNGQKAIEEINTALSKIKEAESGLGKLSGGGKKTRRYRRKKRRKTRRY